MRYQPIENYGIVGNMHSAGLVGSDGSVDWLCVPRFDSPSVFGAILDANEGGRSRIAPAAEGALRRKQFYWPDTNVLITLARRSGSPGNAPADSTIERNMRPILIIPAPYLSSDDKYGAARKPCRGQDLRLRFCEFVHIYHLRAQRRLRERCVRDGSGGWLRSRRRSVRQQDAETIGGVRPSGRIPIALRAPRNRMPGMSAQHMPPVRQSVASFGKSGRREKAVVIEAFVVKEARRSRWITTQPVSAGRRQAWFNGCVKAIIS
jgi:Domain of unknown function (DUF5911)